MASVQTSPDPIAASTPVNEDEDNAAASREGSADAAGSPEASRQGSPTSPDGSPPGSPTKAGAAASGTLPSTPTTASGGAPKGGSPSATAVDATTEKGKAPTSKAKKAAPARKRAAGTAPPRVKKPKVDGSMPREPSDPDNSFKGIFAKDLPSIMYGFGDSSLVPVPESIDALEAIATEYVTDILTKAQHQSMGKPRIELDDVMFVIRKDVRKVQRAQELLKANELLKQAKRAMDDTGKMEMEDLKSLADNNGTIQDLD